ncbi:MAG: hypothetical protein H0T84_12225 [Tatlockia sp.]|nr:hypothetical protein [Tatlockia sp.]
MKLLIAAIGLLGSGLAAAKSLDTPHYKITISCLNSSQNEVNCSKASYQEINKETGAKVNLMGVQVMAKCPDKSTACHSLGYEFSNGNLTYLISENGQLQVLEGAKVLVDEAGTWID